MGGWTGEGGRCRQESELEASGVDLGQKQLEHKDGDVAETMGS